MGSLFKTNESVGIKRLSGIVESSGTANSSLRKKMALFYSSVCAPTRLQIQDHNDNFANYHNFSFFLQFSLEKYLFAVFARKISLGGFGETTA